MNAAEKEIIENTMRGMSQEERQEAVQFIDTDILFDELRKRELAERNFRKAIIDVVANAQDVRERAY